MDKHMKILVADDDPTIEEAISLVLKDEGYTVKKTPENKIVPVAEKEAPALLVLDIYMSGVDGREVCKEVKERKSTRNIPVLLISAGYDIETSARKSGADDFLAKPFDMEQLVSKVNNLLQ